MRNLSSLYNKHIAVVGLGVTGLSCVRFLLAYQEQWNITLCAMDTREDLQVDLSVPFTLGELNAEMLQQADVLLVSPGISLQTPEIVKAVAEGKIVIGDIELFALFYNEHLAQNTSKKLLVVTGSNGKSTVVTLLRDMVEKEGIKTALGGNIGTPALDLFSQDADVFILELSSFQLETTESLQTDVACILNISEDHMDRYANFTSYCAAKQRIYLQAKHVVCNADDNHTFPAIFNVQQTVMTFSAQEKGMGFGLNSSKNAIQLDGDNYIAANQLQLVGLHNLLNVQAASAIAMHIDVYRESITQAAEQFGGLSHRCQKVSDKHGVLWINDSKATNVGATLAAIKGIRPTLSGQLILLAGGDCKQADLSLLEDSFEHDVDRIYLFGKDAAILQALSARAELVSDLESAVSKAAEFAIEGDVVLLSPACASLDMFRNYGHRGDCFIEAVEALA